MHDLSLILLRRVRDMDGLFLTRDGYCPADKYIATLETILSRNRTGISPGLQSLIDYYHHRYGRLPDRLKALPGDQLKVELKRLLSKQCDPKDLGFPTKRSCCVGLEPVLMARIAARHGR